jgi:hypothetical protein
VSILENLISNAGFSIDGRPLHAFRLSDCQHSTLEVEIRKMLATRQYQSASAPFVLWASERYRRDYDGGFLSWDFLTVNGGIKSGHWAAQKPATLGLGVTRAPRRRPVSRASQIAGG